MYNDQSVLENHHLAASFQNMTSDADFTSEMGKSDYMLFRRIMVKCILSTDMANHFDVVKTFKTKAQTGLDCEKPED